MTTSVSHQPKASGHSRPSPLRWEMDTPSLLPFAFAGLEQMDEEHARIRRQFDSLGTPVARDQFERATEIAERLRVDLEAHFAFEELAMARTGYPSARIHCADHAAQLAALTEFLRDIRRAASFPSGLEITNRLLADLVSMKRHLEAHIARHDLALRHHMALAAL